MKGSKKAEAEKKPATPKSEAPSRVANKTATKPAIKEVSESRAATSGASAPARAKAEGSSGKEPSRENVTPVGAETPLSSKPRRDASKGAGPAADAPRKSAKKKTSVVTRVDVGFGNALFIRGSGGGLSWDRGQPLENTSADEWTWESSEAKEPIEFKLLINDEAWSQGENFTAQPGERAVCHPQF